MSNEEKPFGGTKAKERKAAYRQRLIEYLNTYKNIMVIRVDNVGSNQMQQARQMLRGEAVVLMGKNTIIRKVLRDESSKNPALEQLLNYVNGNIGFIFTNGDMNSIRERVQANKVSASARSGQIAPEHVYIEAGITTLDPGQTSFFQAMNIATKITKGAIEIINRVQLIVKNERVTSSAVGLLNKLGQKPFYYAIVVDAVYEDGSVYSAAVLDLTTEELSRKFGVGVAKVAALSLEIGYPTAASVPHSFANALKTLVSISLATDYTFEESKLYKDYLENPELLAAAQAAASASAGGDDAGEAAAAAPEPEEEEEEEEAVGIDMFDADEDY